MGSSLRVGLVAASTNPTLSEEPTPAVKTSHAPSYLPESDGKDDKPPPENVHMDAEAKGKSEINEYFRT